MNGIAPGLTKLPVGGVADMLTVVGNEAAGKGKKRKRHANEPKPPMTAYRRFFAANYNRVKDAQPEGSFSEYSKVLSSEWKELEQTIKDRYQAEYEYELPLYQQQLAQFNAAACNNAISTCRKCGSNDIIVGAGPMQIEIRSTSADEDNASTSASAVPKVSLLTIHSTYNFTRHVQMCSPQCHCSSETAQNPIKESDSASNNSFSGGGLCLHFGRRGQCHAGARYTCPNRSSTRRPKSF